MTAEAAHRPGPYAESALAYWQAGWVGVLPLPVRAKANPPRGYTGADGDWPSFADVHAWHEGREGDGNVALRLPSHVVGIDVDNYGDKRGGETIERAAARWGSLPRTWRSTSREDDVSGIYLYTVPEGLQWPGEVGSDVEVIQHRHRYCVAPPSVHPEGRRYRWLTPDGAVSLTPPSVDELPLLPQSWVEGLTHGALAQHVERAGLDAGGAVSWLSTSGASTCRATRAATTRALADLRTGSRHDAALRATMRLSSLARDGHSGIVPALAAVRDAWLQACDDPARGTVRGIDEAEREWASMLHGAVDVAAASMPTHARDVDPCSNPLHGLIEQGDNPWSTPQHDSSASSGVTTGTPGSAATSSSSTASAADTASGLLPETFSTPLATTDDDAAAVSDVELWRAQLLAQEVERLRARREAQRMLDDEEALRLWREPPSRYSLVEELAQPDEPVAYRVEDVMPVGANVLLTAQFKAGKTTLVNHLTKSLADSLPFLGRFGCNDVGRIALWNYEVDERQYRRWLRDVDIDNAAAVSVLNLRGFRLPLLTARGEDWAVRWLVEHHVTTWVVDPFARAYTGTSENDNTEVGKFLDTLDVIKERANVSDLVLVTHTGRAEQTKGAERARGATRLDDWPDVRWLLMRDEEGQRYWRATGRDVEVAEGSLDFNEHSRSLTLVDGGRKDGKTLAVQEAILKACEMHPGISRSALREFCGHAAGTKGVDTIQKAIDGLVSQGRVYVIEGGKRGTAAHFLGGTGGVL